MCISNFSYKLDPKPSIYLKGFYFLNFLSFSFTPCKTKKAIHRGGGIWNPGTILWRMGPHAPQKVTILWRTWPYAPQNCDFLWRMWPHAPQKGHPPNHWCRGHHISVAHLDACATERHISVAHAKWCATKKQFSGAWNNGAPQIAFHL